jgi:hypothetical protein
MAAGNTYVALATQTLGSATTSITFSSISGSYTDLVLVVNFGCTLGGEVTFLRLNGDSATNFSTTSVYGNGTSVITYRRTNDALAGMNTSNWVGTTTGLNQSNGIYHIMNYSNTTTYKTAIGRSNDASAQTELTVGLWRSTAAITSVTFQVSGSDTLKAGATASLYGIAAA